MTMVVNLAESDWVHLTDALRECLELARTHRRNVGDEDSIILLRNLEQIAGILGVEYLREEK